MHHAVVLFLCFPKILPSPCVSVARVSRIQLYSFGKWEFQFCLSQRALMMFPSLDHLRVCFSHSEWRPNSACLTTVRAISRCHVLYNGLDFSLQM